MATSAQYWRIFVNGATNGSNTVAIAEMTLYGAGNFVPISVAGATFTALSTAGGSSPANAFDGNPNTAWISNAAPTSGAPQWLQVQFSGIVAVASISIAIENNGNWTVQSPPTFLLQSSPDGITWTTQNTVSGFIWDGQAQIAYFDVSITVGKLRLSQAALEVVNASNAHLRLSQVAAETVLNAEPRAKVSQVNVETVLNAAPHVKISQICIEVIYPNVVFPPSAVQQFLLP